jgi:uncharacterized protein (TIGR00369 family)
MNDEEIFRTRLGQASGCFICGPDNKRGLQLEFENQGGEVISTFTADEDLAGYPGVLHGGITSAVLDEVMIKSAFAGGVLTVTAEINVRYRKPVPTGKPLTFVGRIVETRGRMVSAAGEVRDESGTTLASATGRYVRVRGPEYDRLMETLRKTK